jgi:hypothetical protein
LKFVDYEKHRCPFCCRGAGDDGGKAPARKRRLITKKTPTTNTPKIPTTTTETPTTTTTTTITITTTTTP